MPKNYTPWKWLIIVTFLALPMAIFLLPTGILRIFFYFLAEFFNKLSDWVGILDDFLHGLWDKPFHFAVKWSKKKKGVDK